MGDEPMSDEHQLPVDEPAPKRWHFWPRSVRVRLTVLASLVFAIALSAAAFGLVRVVHNHLVDRIHQTNNEQLDALAARLQRTPPDEIQPRPGVLERLPNGNVVLYIYGPAHRGGDTYETRRQVNGVTLVAERSLAEVNSTVHDISTLMYFAVPALIALVAAAAWYFAGRALRPVEEIRAEAEAITGSTMHRRVPEPRTDDEVGRLARTMNAMLDRLETSAQRQRQFVSDASHELRSPLASIRANLEVALRHADRADWPAVASRALAEDERMEDTVGELLELARVDEAHDARPLESLPEVDLDELVLDETVRNAQVPIDTTRVSAGRVHGRREQLSRAIRNLVDNAQRHAATRVALALSNGDGHVELIVDDDGPGIPVDDRERVFDRFTRLDAARARDAGGLGLGLSMVKAIVEQHGGTVAIEDAPIGGARLVVRLPAG